MWYFKTMFITQNTGFTKLQGAPIQLLLSHQQTRLVITCTQSLTYTIHVAVQNNVLFANIKQLLLCIGK